MPINNSSVYARVAQGVVDHEGLYKEAHCFRCRFFTPHGRRTVAVKGNCRRELKVIAKWRGVKTFFPIVSSKNEACGSFETLPTP